MSDTTGSAVTNLSTAKGPPCPNRYRAPRSATRWVDGVGPRTRGGRTRERDASGRPIRLFGTVQDVTDRHVVIDALKASEERYRRIVENTSEGVWMYDQRITTFMNGRLASLIGYTVDEAVGQSIYTFLPAATRAPTEAWLRGSSRTLPSAWTPRSCARTPRNCGLRSSRTRSSTANRPLKAASP
jgi:PAS domain-containing protein